MRSRGVLKSQIKIMARESVKILQGKLDVESLISQLNAALAEEWLAYYQYWVGALVVEGAMRADVQSEFEEHAEEERKHAQLLANRIIELTPNGIIDKMMEYDEYITSDHIKELRAKMYGDKL
mgnify:FL=1